MMRGIGIPTSQNLNITTYVHLTATAARLADGRLQASGTISPAQPGRKVRLDRRLKRVCNQRQYGPTLLTPSSVGVPWFAVAQGQIIFHFHGIGGGTFGPIASIRIEPAQLFTFFEQFVTEWFLLQLGV